MLDENAPRPRLGQALRDLARDDLELLSVEELDERVAALEAEIGRTHAQRDRKQAGRSAADRLFSGFSAGGED